jgi:subtilase family serine protease
MKPISLLTAAAILSFVLPAMAGEPTFHPLPYLVPESAGVSPLDLGKRAHTHLRILVTAAATSANNAQYNTPSTIRSVYNLPATGGSGAIAVVDAYDYPTALADFNYFAKYFSLPTETSTNATNSTNTQFQVVYAGGIRPMSGGSYISSWDSEAALDIEWAHAIAPKAKIYLVEAASDNFDDLNYAVQIAASLPGVKEVSMSWGGDEFNYESTYDAKYLATGVVFFAAGGDSNSICYPASSPNVIACGGTTLNRNTRTAAFTGETAWNDTGCGPSLYEPRPAFQSAISRTVGSYRGTNDLSFEADPNTGVYVWDSTPLYGQSGWSIYGGTSVATPCLAAEANLAASSHGFATSSAAEETRIYGHLSNAQSFRDITSGRSGRYSAGTGWDYVTGVGSPISLNGL